MRPQHGYRAFDNDGYWVGYARPIPVLEPNKTLRCTCNADVEDIVQMGHLDDCPYWQPMTLAGDGWLFDVDEY